VLFSNGWIFLGNNEVNLQWNMHKLVALEIFFIASYIETAMVVEGNL
jgi:hypothetical protein